MMDRRTFVTGLSALLTASLAAEAQQAGKVQRIDYLSSGSATDNPNSEAFRQGLRELGWVEGQNIAIDYRFGEGQFDRLPDLAAELSGNLRKVAGIQASLRRRRTGPRDIRTYAVVYRSSGDFTLEVQAEYIMKEIAFLWDGSAP